MADRWMDERDREWRERDWRRSEAYGRGEGRMRPLGARRDEESRSWSAGDDRYGEEPSRRQPGYGRDEQDYGSGSGVIGGGPSYGAQPRAYGAGGAAPRFSTQDYTAGRGEADRWSGQDQHAWGADRTRRYEDEHSRRYADELRRRADSYGDDWIYGDADRAEHRAREPWDERGEHGSDRGPERARDDNRNEGASDFLKHAGERISSWFRGDNLMRGSREDDGGSHRYREDFGREARPIDPGRRGLGPKGYKRSDERISEDVHDRLTDDPWLDASRIEVEVKSGEVTLSGHVDNREAKHRAERLIEDLPGVGHVQNNLRVDTGADLTGSGRGFGSSALEAEMRRNEPSATGSNGSGEPKAGKLS